MNVFAFEHYLSQRSEIGQSCAISTSKYRQLSKVDMNGTLKGKIKHSVVMPLNSSAFSDWTGPCHVPWVIDETP